MRKQRAPQEWFDQVEVFIQRERYSEAITLLRRHGTEAKNDWQHSWNWGWCYFKSDNFQTAKTHLHRATLLAPDKPACHWAYGLACLEARNYRVAEKSLSQALSLKDSHLARLSLALTYMKLGRVEEAEQVHLQGIALRPDTVKRYKAYADFLFDVGRKKEEQKVRRKAREIARK